MASLASVPVAEKVAEIHNNENQNFTLAWELKNQTVTKQKITRTVGLARD